MKFTLSLIVSISCTLAYCQQSHIDSLENLIKTYPKEDTVKIQKLIDFSRELTNTGNYEHAIKMAVDAAELAEKLHELPNVKSKLAVAYKYIGINHYYLGNFNNAMEYFISSSKVFEEIGDKRSVAGTYNNIGEIHRLKGNYDMALEYYFTAIKILDEFGEDLKVAAIYNNVGMLQKDYKKALEFYLLAIKKYEESNRKNPDDANIKFWMGNAYTNIGNIHKDKGEFDNAAEYYYKALNIREKAGDKKGIADSYIGLGLIHAEKSFSAGNDTKALDFYNKALKLKEEIGDKQGLAMVYGDIGILFLNQKEISKSKLYLLQSLDFAKEIQSKPIMQQNYLNLSQCDSALGNYKDAYEYYKLFIQIKDSIFNSETAEKTAELQTRYESEKKEKEIELLKKDGEIQSADLKRQKLLSYSVIIGLLSVAIVAIIIFRSLKITRNQKKIIETQKGEVISQKKLVEEKQKDILDSITYAKRLQEAILPPIELIRQFLPQTFIFYKPKDIVAGDFYWMEKVDNTIFIAAADCTGHGVPGAMVSIVCNNALNRAIKEFQLRETGKILDKVTDLVLETFEKSTAEVKDGMDISLLAIQFPSPTEKDGRLSLQWSGANNPLWYLSDANLTELKADKQPVGKFSNRKPFTTNPIEVEGGCTFFLFTDGFADQFGGPKGKKFKYKQLEEKIFSMADLPMEKQKNKLNKIFSEWKGNLEQVDDITIIGVKILKPNRQKSV